jgi:hypothetical protein
MKRFFSLAFVIILGVLLLSSCGASGGIVGKWKVVEASGLMADINKGVLYEFSADGKLVMSTGILRNEATYTIAGEKLSYKVGPLDISATVVLAGDTMTLKINNSDQKFVLKRQ